MASIENMSTDELKQLLAKKRAQESFRQLESSGINDFKNAVANTSDLNELRKIAQTFAQKVYQATRFLEAPKPRKSKKE